MTVNQEFWFTFWFTVWFTANYLIISLLQDGKPSKPKYYIEL